MYQVRWSLTGDAPDCKVSYDEAFDAWKIFYEMADSDGVSFVGIYSINSDGEEKEMETWWMKGENNKKDHGIKYHVELCPPDIDPPMAAWVMRGPDVICMCWMEYDAEMIVRALNYATEIAELSAKSKMNTNKWHRANR